MCNSYGRLWVRFILILQLSALLGESENSAVTVFTNCVCCLPGQVREHEHTNLHYSEPKHANRWVGCVKTTRDRLRRPNRFNSVRQTKANLQVVEQTGVQSKDGPAKENKSRNGPKALTPKPRSIKWNTQTLGGIHREGKTDSSR